MIRETVEYCFLSCRHLIKAYFASVELTGVSQEQQQERCVYVMS